MTNCFLSNTYRFENIYSRLMQCEWWKGDSFYIDKKRMKSSIATFFSRIAQQFVENSDTKSNIKTLQLLFCIQNEIFSSKKNWSEVIHRFEEVEQCSEFSIDKKTFPSRYEEEWEQVLENGLMDVRLLCLHFYEMKTERFLFDSCEIWRLIQLS